MSFSLPELPYAYDALAPHMSRETLEYHHDKHHLAYVNTANNLLKGTELEGKSVEEVVKASYGKNAALFNNAGQHYNHTHFWKWMKPQGGGDKIPGKLEKKIAADLGSVAKMKEEFIQAGVTQFGSGWCWQLKTARLSLPKPRMEKILWCMAPSRFWVVTSGSTRITLIIATGVPITSRHSSTTWSIGNMSRNCSRRRRSSCARKSDRRDFGSRFWRRTSVRRRPTME